ncbi:MAG TPA: hypothetical protein VKX25_14095 [Bryobacteraceae bacterium]|jgi:hypothetical protein|nr:hypothetical protein [Bryobacteraceae bacterium]
MRISRFVWVLCAMSLFAQDTSLPRPRLDQLSQKEFDKMLRKGLDQRQQEAARVLELAEGTRECSIPLLEYRVKHPERYTMRRVPAGPGLDAMAKPAGPVCKW